MFTSEDSLSGPVRTTLAKVLYCGSPTFYKVEVSGTASTPPIDPLSPADLTCPTSPSWQSMSSTSTLQDLIDNDRIIYGGDLDLPELNASNYSATLLCDVVDSSAVTPDCFAPDELVNPVAINDMDTISPRTVSDITIHELVLNGSATVYASGDIIICGDIEARGTNPAGGPNVIALVTEGDVILDPNGQTPSGCGIATSTPLSGRPSFWETTPPPPLRRRWGRQPRHHPLQRRDPRSWRSHLRSKLEPSPRPAGGPTLIIQGSIAAKHLGLYGIPDPALDGTVDAGWAKNFIYPPDFWLARPPWWPDFDGNEWA